MDLSWGMTDRQTDVRPLDMFIIWKSVRVLSLRSSVIHGFVTEPWFSRYVRVSCERAASSVLKPCALSSACLDSCWSVVFRSWHSCLEFRFRVRVRTLMLHVLSHCVSVWSRVRSAACSSVHVCFVVLHAVCVHVLFCSCLVICLLAMFLCFCFVWAHGFCLSFLCAMCSHANCLDPTILYPDYWLICPTCLPSLPSSFAPFIISLCLQSCASSSSNVSHSCLVLSCLVLSCLVLSCRALPCPALPCQALPAVLFFPYGVVFVAVFFFFVFYKAHSPAQLSLRLIPSSQTLTENILQNTYFCVPQNKETHTSKNDESLFCVNYLFKSRKKVKYILLLLTSLHGYYTLTAHEPFWRYEKSS